MLGRAKGWATISCLQELVREGHAAVNRGWN